MKDDKVQVRAKLTTFDTTMIVVSLVIGIGIFRTPAMVASSTKTVFLFFLAWVLGGLISLTGALTYAEIGARFPKPGSYYKVVAESYHSSIAFMLNWTNILIQFGAGAAAIAIIGAEYLNPILLPPDLQTPSAIRISATVMFCVLLLINYLGIKTGAWAQNVLTLLKIGMMLVLCVVAFTFRGDPMTESRGIVMEKPFWFALGVGLISVFYTYGGYQNTINFGADVKNARRNVPRAIFFGIMIIIALYLLINFAYFRVLGMPGIASAKLVAAEVARVCFGPVGHLIISLSIVISALGFLNVVLMHIPRAYYAMAEDGALPAVFMRVNQRTQVQEFTLFFLGGTILFSLFFLGTFEKIVNYVMFVDSLSLALVASTVFVLRLRAYPSPDYEGYRVPLYPILPAVYVCFLVFISVNVLVDDPVSALYGVFVVLLGLPVFLLMRRVSGRKRRGQP